MYEVYNVLCYSLIIICRMSIMIAISKIMMFCLFSRAYSFQWNALYKKVMSHRNNPTKQGHMPKLAPQIQEHTIPIIISINADISISLRYFFIVLYCSLRPSRNHHYSLFLVSIQIVTGPSFSNSTFISAPNLPVPTCFPIASESWAQKAS